MNEVTLLFMETSDQLGTSEPVGVYSDIALAMKASEGLRSRWYTRTFVLDAPPKDGRNRGETGI